MPIVAVDLGASPTGAGGDTHREAFEKLNTSIAELDLRGEPEPGEDGVGVPVGGTTGQVLTKASGSDFDTSWATAGATILEAVAGGAGFASVSGAVTMDLASARSFHHEMTGNITSLTFTNVPTETAFSATWTWVLRINGTGGYILSSTPNVTWVDGSTWADLNLVANAVNVVSFTRVGTVTYGAIITNGSIELDPYVLSFPTNGAQLVVVTRAETIDLGGVTNVEADGTAGTGTLSYKKNGGAASGSTAFVAGDVLEVTMASSTTPSAVSIPRSRVSLNQTILPATSALAFSGLVPVVVVAPA